MLESRAAEPAAFPLARGSLIGRDADLVVLVDLLASDRPPVITLTGPGGVGKSRLALESLRRAGHRFEAVVAVPLAGLDDPAMVLTAIAHCFGLRTMPGQSVLATLAAALAGRSALLLLDNAEHLVAAAPDIAGLVAACPDLVLLVTSRRPLRLSDEQRMPVAPLALPPAGAATAAEAGASPAVALFAERAAAADPGFALSDANAREVAAVVRQLDGLPLAIELVAARSGQVVPEPVTIRLRDDDPDQVDERRPAGERWQTIRGAIGWSHDLLTPSEQRLFRRLGVFDGGFTLSSAVAMADLPAADEPPIDPLAVVAALVDASLVQPVRGGSDEPRFAMLETVRAVALERLDAAGERNAAEGVRAERMLALADAAEPSLIGPGERAAHPPLLAELANLRGAIAWATDHQPTIALRLCADLWLMWLRNGLPEDGEHQMAALLARAFQTSLALPEGDAFAERRFALLAGAVADRLGDERTRAKAEFIAGVAEAHLGEREAADRWWAVALPVLAEGTCDTDRAVSNYIRASRLLVRAASVPAELALELFDEALSEVRASGSDFVQMVLLNDLAGFRLGLGQPAAARPLLLEARRIAAGCGDQWAVGYTLAVLALADAADGDAATAARRLGAGEAVLSRIGLTMPPVLQARADGAARIAAGTIGEAAFAAARDDGAARRETVLLEALQPGEPVVATAPARAGGPLHELTSREQTVLASLVAGRTDRQIADVLGISRKTASNHVSSIIAKLGTDNRTAAVAVAVAAGLALI